LEYFSQQDYELGDVRPCTVLHKYQHFGETCCHCFQTAGPSQTQIPTDQATWCHIK